MAGEHPVRAANLKDIYRQRMSMIDDGVISPAPRLVEPTRELLRRLEALDDDDLVEIEAPDGGDAVFRLLPSREVLAVLPVGSRSGT